LACRENGRDARARMEDNKSFDLTFTVCVGVFFWVCKPSRISKELELFSVLHNK
jgi:hypothetical protein